MDFMNFMNQFNGSNFGNACECDSPCSSNNKFRDLLPLLLLGMGQCTNNQSGGNLTCYPNNNYQQFTMANPYSCCGSNIKYRKKKVRQAYVEMPVSTYQVVQPTFSNMQQPMTMNIIPNGFRNNDLLTTMLILFMLISRNKVNSNNQNVGCSISSEI